MRCIEAQGWRPALQWPLFFNFVAPVAASDDDRWIGREFLSKSTCRPKIGTGRRSCWNGHAAKSFRVQKVQGDWLWTGQAWVKKQDVVAAAEPIEEFTVARNGRLLIVPVEIDGREYPFIVDTGSHVRRPWILRAEGENCSRPDVRLLRNGLLKNTGFSTHLLESQRFW